MPVHLVENNYIRNFVVLTNKIGGFLNSTTTYANFDALIADTASTVASLRAKALAVGGISRISQYPVILEYSRVIDQLTALTFLMSPPVAVSGSNITTAATGGGLVASTAYYLKVVAVDAAGRLSTPSAQMTKTTAADAPSTHVVTIKNFAVLDGAASYRIYPSATTGVFTSGYFAVTKANLEGATGGTLTDLTTQLTAGTIPTAFTATAQTAALSDADIVAAVAATSGETAALLARVIAKSYPAPAVLITASAGEQWI